MPREYHAAGQKRRVVDGVQANERNIWRPWKWQVSISDLWCGWGKGTGGCRQGCRWPARDRCDQFYNRGYDTDLHTHSDKSFSPHINAKCLHHQLLTISHHGCLFYYYLLFPQGPRMWCDTDKEHCYLHATLPTREERNYYCLQGTARMGNRPREILPAKLENIRNRTYS